MKKKANCIDKKRYLYLEISLLVNIKLDKKAKIKLLYIILIISIL